MAYKSNQLEPKTPATTAEEPGAIWLLEFDLLKFSENLEEDLATVMHHVKS